MSFAAQRPPESSPKSSSDKKAFFDKSLVAKKEEKDISEYTNLSATELLDKALAQERVALLVLKNASLLKKLGRYNEQALNDTQHLERILDPVAFERESNLITGYYLYQLCNKWKNSTAFRSECGDEIKQRLGSEQSNTLFGPITVYYENGMM